MFQILIAFKFSSDVISHFSAWLTVRYVNLLLLVFCGSVENSTLLDSWRLSTRCIADSASFVRFCLWVSVMAFLASEC